MPDLKSGGAARIAPGEEIAARAEPRGLRRPNLTRPGAVLAEVIGTGAEREVGLRRQLRDTRGVDLH